MLSNASKPKPRYVCFVDDQKSCNFNSFIASRKKRDNHAPCVRDEVSDSRLSGGHTLHDGKGTEDIACEDNIESVLRLAYRGAETIDAV